jgi:fructokinase
VQRKPGVLVLGEALIDRFAETDVVGGAPFNVARSLSALGVPTMFVGRIHDGDALGRRIIDSALSFGLPLAGLQRDPCWPTGLATVKERGRDHGFHIQGPAAWDFLELNEARAALHDAQPQLICFGTLAQRNPVAARTIHQILDESPALRFLDLNLRPGQDNRCIAEASLLRADWVKVNDEELRSLLVWFLPEAPAHAHEDSDEMRAAIAGLTRRFGWDRLVVTRAERGYAAYDARGRLIARAGGVADTRVVDTVGAGDAFAAALLACWARGLPAERSLDAANRYAAAICTERGPLPEDPEFFHWV